MYVYVLSYRTLDRSSVPILADTVIDRIMVRRTTNKTIVFSWKLKIRCETVRITSKLKLYRTHGINGDRILPILGVQQLEQMPPATQSVITSICNKQNFLFKLSLNSSFISTSCLLVKIDIKPIGSKFYIQPPFNEIDILRTLMYDLEKTTTEADMRTGQGHAHWSRLKCQQEIKTKRSAEGTYTVSVPYSSWNMPAEIPTITKGRPTTVEWAFCQLHISRYYR